MRGMAADAASGKAGIGFGTVLFVLIAAGYFGLEMYAASRNAYRMEPGFIYGQYLEAARAVELCSPDAAGDYPRFSGNFDYARRRAAALTDSAALQQQEQKLRSEISELVKTLGCADIEIFKLRKRYENLARQNLPTGK